MEYIISDLHFNHNNIINFERTSFSTIEEHDMFIIKQWNKIVYDTDIVYILGDLGGPKSKLEEYFKLLKGSKILILGNHDEYSVEFYKNLDGVKNVYNTPVFIRKRIVLSHEPIRVNEDILNIHGHLHNASLTLNNYINTNCHILDYKPVKFKKIENKLYSLPKLSNKFLEEWYAPYYNFTKNK